MSAYDFFPTFAINGPIQRYNGEFTYIKSAFALRGEFDQLNMSRNNTGSEQVGGLGFVSLPSIIAKAWNIGATYLLTGESQPENGTPRVRHPLFGPDTPGGKGRGWGAFGVGARYMGIHANEPGANLLDYYTPGFVPTYNYHTDEITMGLTWYPNYWVKYQVNLGIDQLKDPSTIGAYRRIITSFCNSCSSGSNPRGGRVRMESTKFGKSGGWPQPVLKGNRRRIR